MPSRCRSVGNASLRPVSSFQAYAWCPTSQTILSLGRVELVEQRDAQLDHAEAGADVAAGLGHALDQPLADLLGQLREAGRGGAA